ncbi:hypothetical protein MKX03_003286 [Papaver bracteatum]|nr:hypothetical protein MKX03_003286 [Papaver bracteatum]
MLEKLDKVFSCPFCNHLHGLECVMDTKLRIGSTICRVCDAHYNTKINRLTEHIDIYNE